MPGITLETSPVVPEAGVVAFVKAICIGAPSMDPPLSICLVLSGPHVCCVPDRPVGTVLGSPCSTKPGPSFPALLPLRGRGLACDAPDVSCCVHALEKGAVLLVRGVSTVFLVRAALAARPSTGLGVVVCCHLQVGRVVGSVTCPSVLSVVPSVVLFYDVLGAVGMHSVSPPAL